MAELTVHLPEPDGHDDDGMPWWRQTDGERIYAAQTFVYTPDGGTEYQLFRIEWDALVRLAAVQHTQNQIRERLSQTESTTTNQGGTS